LAEIPHSRVEDMDETIPLMAGRALSVERYLAQPGQVKAGASATKSDDQGVEHSF
jgi:hypothetical protein